MKRRIQRRWIGCLCAAILLGGCRASTEEVVEEPTTTAAAPATAASDAAAPAVGEPKTLAAANAATSSPEPTALQAFKPPFPSRLELFEPPKRTQGNVRKGDEVGATVELKGFINVNGPRVVLSIDGVIALIPEGGEKYGVQVLSIDPPNVVLQRGRTRWPAKLE
jgi:hypothetical protein